MLLRKIEQRDIEGMKALADDPEVYRYLPTSLFEKKYEDMAYVIDHLYDEALKDSLFLGLFVNDEFCGIVELYGLRLAGHKISVGYRLLKRCWGKGIATRAVKAMVRYLKQETKLTLITASTMLDNDASAKVLRKCGFRHASTWFEDWGFDHPLLTKKWGIIVPVKRK